VASFWKAILWRALLGTPSLLSSNWLAAFASLVVFCWQYFAKVRKRDSWQHSQEIREKTAAVFAHFREDVLASFKPVLIIWICLFAYSLAKTIYNDHSTLAQGVARANDANKQEQNTSQSLQGQVQNLQRQLDATKHRQPEDTELEIDAYQLADQIETWFAAPDGVFSWLEQPKSFDQLQPTDDARFSHAPAHWEPSNPSRDHDWSTMVIQRFNTNFQSRVISLAEHFKERGVFYDGPTNVDINNVTGPVGIRAAINYLRKSAAQLEFKRRTRGSTAVGASSAAR
jgi:hypothetical protein